MAYTLSAAYRFNRAAGYTASHAIRHARRAGKFSAPPPKSMGLGAKMDDGGQWCENPPFRMTGIRGNGYYTSDDCDETYIGVVFQMTAKDGKERYFPGVAESWNKGSAILYLSEVTDDEGMAHSWANLYAERRANDERDYQADWQRGEDAGVLDSEIAELLAEAAELKAALESENGGERLRRAAQERLESIEDEISEKQDEIANLEGYSSNMTAFMDGRASV